jgi:hypothetical protein
MTEVGTGAYQILKKTYELAKKEKQNLKLCHRAAERCEEIICILDYAKTDEVKKEGPKVMDRLRNHADSLFKFIKSYRRCNRFSRMVKANSFRTDYHEIERNIDSAIQLVLLFQNTIMIKKLDANKKNLEANQIKLLEIREAEIYKEKVPDSQLRLEQVTNKEFGSLQKYWGYEWLADYTDTKTKDNPYGYSDPGQLYLRDRFKFCGITIQDVDGDLLEDLLPALSHMISIKILNLGGNKIDCARLDKLQTAMEKMSSLNAVNLSPMDPSSDYAVKLQKKFPHIHFTFHCDSEFYIEETKELIDSGWRGI